MSRDKQGLHQKAEESLPVARELALELEYDEGDPREAMREAFEYKPTVDEILNSDKSYNDYLLMSEGAPKGKLLAPTVELTAAQEGKLQQYELGALKTAYQLNELGELSCQEAREVVEAEKAIASKYNIKTPLTKFTDLVNKSSKAIQL